MQFKTSFDNETISECQTDYGTGGAFPALAPMIESEAEVTLATHLFPGFEDAGLAMEGHQISSRCVKARELEKQGVLDDGEYPVEVTVDGKKYDVLVEMAW